MTFDELNQLTSQIEDPFMVAFLNRLEGSFEEKMEEVTDGIETKIEVAIEAYKANNQITD